MVAQSIRTRLPYGATGRSLPLDFSNQLFYHHVILPKESPHWNWRNDMLTKFSIFFLCLCWDYFSFNQNTKKSKCRKHYILTIWSLKFSRWLRVFAITSLTWRTKSALTRSICLSTRGLFALAAVLISRTERCDVMRRTNCRITVINLVLYWKWVKRVFFCVSVFTLECQITCRTYLSYILNRRDCPPLSKYRLENISLPYAQALTWNKENTTWDCYKKN